MREQARGVTRAESGGGFLYGWLLLALFIEYARPTNQLTFLEFPFFYSLVPMSLLLASMFAQGLRPANVIFEEKTAKYIVALVALVFISWVFTGFHSYGSEVFRTVLGYLFLFILIARIVTTVSRFRGVVITLVIAHFYLLVINHEVITVGDRSHYLTGGTFLGDGNDYSLSLCILFPLMIDIALAAVSKWRKLLAWCSVVVIILAIVATQSRGGTLALAGVLLYLWIRSPRKIVGVVGIVMVATIILLYSPPGYFQRINTVTSMQIDGSAQGRINAWKAAIGMAAGNPVLGIGVGQFGPRWGQTAHSSYFLALGEMGVPGLVCVLAIVIGNIRATGRMRRRVLESGRSGEGRNGAQVRIAKTLEFMIAATLGFAIAGAFLSATYYPHLFVLTALLISGRIMAAQKAGVAANGLLLVRESQGRNANGPQVTSPRHK